MQGKQALVTLASGTGRPIGPPPLERLPDADAVLRRDLAFSRSVLGALNWNGGRRAQACAAWRSAAAGFAPLVREGRLSVFDREHSLAYVTRNVAICDGVRPASDYRSPD